MSVKPALTPLPKEIKFNTNNYTLLIDPERYSRLIGRLFYLYLRRLDISFQVQEQQHTKETNKNSDK